MAARPADHSLTMTVVLLLAAAAAATAACPDSSWYRLGDTCYKVFAEKVSCLRTVRIPSDMLEGEKLTGSTTACGSLST